MAAGTRSRPNSFQERIVPPLTFYAMGRDRPRGAREGGLGKRPLARAEACRRDLAWPRRFGRRNGKHQGPGPTTIIPSKLSPEERVEALRALEKRFANADRPEVGDEEEESVVNEALRSTRPEYKPAG